MRHVKTATPLLLALLAGCSLIPSYQRPGLPVSGQYPVGADAAYTGPEAQMAAWDIGWRDFFADPALQGLIALSLANNRNLRIATLDVSQAQAQYRVDRASLFPAINATAGEDAYHTPAGIMGGNANPINYREYSLGVGAVSWELDLFGKIRSQAKAAQETYLSDADTALSVKIALVSQVASAYYTWLADREALQISQDTATAMEHSLQLTQLAASKGIYTAMDVAEAQTTVDTAQANVAMYTRQVADDMNDLVLLAGASIPPALQQQMNAVSGLDASPKLPYVPAGLPSDLLERRPDIRAAEHQLLAANANIGAARAAFFPSVSLTASGQTASPGLSNLFGMGSGAWLFEQ